MRTPPVESITILMPCKSQKREFFLDAVSSIVHQDSPGWELLVLTDPAIPAGLSEWVASFGDARIRLCASPRPGFAQALNHGMEEARSEFVSILLSDDRYAPNAISTLLAYRERYRDADFFHSARRYIDEAGRFRSEAMPSRKEFGTDYFKTRGSPVKHLLCWRLAKAREIGGMNESLSVHGCDDYDFPWRMAEAGARFQALDECLYEYRNHLDHDRLTTTVPIGRQIETIAAMFASHGVPALETGAYIQRAARRYLVQDHTGQFNSDRGTLIPIRLWREASADDAGRFKDAGFKERHFFPHRAVVLPKGGPDGLKLARRTMGVANPALLREMVLYALPPVRDQFPESLYFDDDIVWHQQQFGVGGQVACANFTMDGTALRCYLLQSDLVQRIARNPRHRTRIDNRFKGWAHMLVNALLAHARENGMESLYVPVSEFVLRHTDRRRDPKPPLYRRIYDDTPARHGAIQEGDWWRVDIRANGRRIAELRRTVEADPLPKTVCLIHDIERGLGHVGVDSHLARRAEEQGPEALRRMLEIEGRLGVRATYNVVGKLLPEIEGQIRAGGHAIAFHSFDHRFDSDPEGMRQLSQCRKVDYRIKGYRAPQSKLVAGLRDENLSEHNFEWFGSSARSFGFESPRMENGIVKTPIHRDDFPLYRDGVSFASWEDELLGLIRARDYVTFGLHDCYAHLWLDQYEDFLRKVMERATLLTLDELAARVTLGQSHWFEPKP